MELFLELFLQFVGEVLIQLTAEMLAELGQHSLEDTFKKRRHPVLSTIGFTLWGAIFAGLSLLVIPTSLIHNPDLRLFNLIVTPLLAGAAMVAIGLAREKKGQEKTRINRFGFAYAFALSFAAIRFAFAG